MNRVILPVRSRLSRPASGASRGITPSSASAPRGASIDEISDRPVEANSNPCNLIVSKEKNESCQTPIPSIERSPSPSFTVTTDQNGSPALTPSPTIHDALEREVEPPTAGETTITPIFTFVGQRSPTPSMSISNPPSLIAATRSSVAVSDIESTGLTSRLQDLGMASGQSSQQPGAGFDMWEIGDAIHDIAQGVGTSRDSGFLVVSPPEHSRRRSSPRREPVIHRVEDEEPPNDEFNSPAFQGRLSQANSILKGLASILSSSPILLEPDSTIKRHHREAENLSNFSPLSTRIVGLVGDSGAGKSSLINSLLDKDSLARTTGKGAAGTCVATEYHFHEKDEFIIDVEMFSEDELREQLGQLLGSYRAFKSGAQGESKEKADLAMDTFRCMFREKLQDEDWILNEPEDVVLAQFKTWAKLVMDLGSPGIQVVQTLEECSSKLVQHSSEPNDTRQSSVWPYVRKIKVYLKAHILSKGLVLVDLPGLQDLNSARRNITQQYIVNCHEIFAICIINRVLTTVGVQTIFDLAKQARLERVGIICTNADEVNLKEAERDWDQGETRQIKELNESLRAVDEEIQKIGGDLDNFDHLQGDAARLALHEKKRKLEIRRNAIEFERQECAITTRNSHVIKKLKAPPQHESLHVFCVGNEMYREKRNLDKSVSWKYLSLSGVIGVRRHLIAAVGESQLRASKRFLEHNVPALLQDIELWVQSGAGSASAEKKQAVRRVLCKSENTLKKGLTPVDTIKTSLKDSFKARIWEGLQISKWEESSKYACEEWDTWAPGSYAAWLRADGDHRTKAQGHRNWNMEVMRDMAADLESPWNDLTSDIRAHQVHLKQAIFACWEEAIADLESEWPGSNDQVDEIGRAMDVRKHLLLDRVEDIYDRFTDGLSLLRVDTLTWLSGSMITRIMSSVCRQAIEQRGDGCTEKRQEIVKGTFTDKATFKSMTRELRRSFKDHAERLQQEMDDLVSTHLDAIRATLDIVREGNDAEVSDMHPEFRERVAGEVARARSLLGI